jgi:SAM-dependent methyltransferase
MFFPEKIHLSPGDRVLEVGPGASPYPGSQIFLEKRFADAEAVCQRGGLPPIELPKPVIYYDGGRFPFGDQEFDYVICSHVLEHVQNPEDFLRELMRVAPRGYLEFPTVYYEYLYNFKEHVNLVVHKDGEILWMPKCETTLDGFDPVQRFLRNTLESGYDHLIQAMKEKFFQGFEWSLTIRARRVRHLQELIPLGAEVLERCKQAGSPPRGAIIRELWQKARQRIRKPGS